MAKYSKKEKAKNAPARKSFWDYCTSAPLVYFIFFICIFLVYGQVLSFFLGKLDEPDIILANLRFLSDFGNLKEALSRDAFFSTGDGSFYRPVQNISFMIDAHLSGSKAWGYYLSNILIHGTTVSVLFYLLTMLGNNKKAAFLAALFFAVSPLFVQAIAWAPSRGDMLTGMFGILSFVFFIRFIRSGNYTYLIYNLLTMTLAVFSKETAMLLPLLFLFYYLMPVKDAKITGNKLILPAVSYSLIIILYLFLRKLVILNPPSDQVFGIMPLLNNLRAVPEFISKFILPFHLSPMAGYSLIITLTGTVIIASLAFLIFKYIRSSAVWMYFGCFWFLLFLFPTLLYAHPMGSHAYDYLEHRAYLPAVGLVIMLYFCILRFENEKPFRHIYSYLLLICILFGTYAHVYSANYANPVTFYDRVIDTNPNSAMALYNRGEISVFRDKDYQTALSDFNKAISILPEYPKAYVNRGICKEFMGDTLGALQDCENGVKLDPKLFLGYKNIAIINYQLGENESALKAWEKALEISPDFFQGFNEKGLIYMQMQNFPKAEAELNHCIQLNNSFPDAFLNRGLLYYKMNDLSKACADWSTAADLGSNDALNLMQEYCGK